MSKRELWQAIFWCIEMAALIFLFVTYFFWDVPNWTRWLAALVLIVSSIVMSRICRCPYCGKSVMINPFSRDREDGVYCRNCGNKVW